MSSMAARFAYGLARRNTRSRKTRCFIDETQEAITEESHLWDSALVLMVTGMRPSLIPEYIVEGIKEDFPELSNKRLSGLSHVAGISFRSLRALPVVRHGSWGGCGTLPRNAAPSATVQQDHLRHIGSMPLQR